MIKQKSYTGVESIKNLKLILNEIKAKKIFLVTGKKSYHLSGAKKQVSDLISNYEITHFTDFSSNPKIEDIIKGIEILNSKEFDLIIAIGGGSVLDTAKSINVLSKQKCHPSEYLTKVEEIKDKGLPFVAIPTTSGSGSESTHFAVVYSNGKKYSLAHKEFFLPDYYILDPLLTKYLPKKTTAACGLDALSQAIESLWSVNSNNESDFYAKKAINLIVNNFEKVLKNSNIDSRKAMMEAANYSGKAINITKTTAPHAFSYFLTQQFGIPHGHAVALTIGPILEYNAKVTEEDCNDVRGSEHIIKKINDICSLIGCNSPKEANEFLTNLISKSGLEKDFKKLGISKEDITTLAENVNNQRLKNNPRKFFDSEMIKKFFFNSFYKENKPNIKYEESKNKSKKSATTGESVQKNNDFSGIPEIKIPPEHLVTSVRDLPTARVSGHMTKHEIENNASKGVVIWFTGLSGSGKTTIASNLTKIIEDKNKKVFLLDGDNIRATINKDLGFSRNDVKESNYRIACLAEEKIKEFDFVLACVMSPFTEDRERARSVIGKDNFFEIFVYASLNECIKRDVKGLYKKALTGEIKDMVGIDPSKNYEIPKNPHLIVNTMSHSIEENMIQLISFIKSKTLI